MIEINEVNQRPVPNMKLSSLMPGIIFRHIQSNKIFMKTVKGMFDLKELREIELNDNEESIMIIETMTNGDVCRKLKLTLSELQRLCEYWKKRLCPELTQPRMFRG